MMIERLAVGVYGANCYIIGCPTTKEAIIVDPGGDGDKILARVEERELTVKYILLTHGHGDHIGAAKEIKDYLKVPILIHHMDEAMLKDPNLNLSSAIPMENVSITADKTLNHGDQLSFGQMKSKVIHTPGHTTGSICLLVDGHLLTGDTLFKGSIGRTDLPGGSFDRMEISLAKQILPLEDTIRIYPGHGPESTIGYEKRTNPYINN